MNSLNTLEWASTDTSSAFVSASVGFCFPNNINMCDAWRDSKNSAESSSVGWRRVGVALYFACRRLRKLFRVYSAPKFTVLSHTFPAHLPHECYLGLLGNLLLSTHIMAVACRRHWENIFRKLYKFTLFQLLVRHTKNLYFLSLAISLSSFFSLTLSATTTVTRDLFADTTTCKKRRRNDMKKKNFLHNMKYWTDGSRKNVGRICLKECGISCSAQAQCVDSIQGIFIDIANFKSRHVHQICKSFFSPSRFFPNLFGENFPPPQADVLILETTTDTSTRRCRWRRERDQYSRESLFACHEVSEDVFNFPSIFFHVPQGKKCSRII